MKKYCKTWKIQGHDEDQCNVIYPELFDKRNGLEAKGDSDKMKSPTEGTDNKEATSTNQKGEEGMKEKWWNQAKGKRKQVWNQRLSKENAGVIRTNNQFNALEDRENKRDKVDTQDK